MRVRAISLGQISTLLIVLLLGLPILSEAGVFWTENFENHLTPNWDTSACGGSPADGCNAAISTDLVHGGTYSLKSTFLASCEVAGCGSYYDRAIPASNEVWIRFYYYTTNFTYYPVTVTKLFILVPNANGNQFYFSNDFGDNRMSVAVGNNNNFQVQTCPNGKVDVGCSYPPNMASVPFSDNQWFCVEGHTINNTVGQSNGTVELFVNGVQTVGVYNQQTQNVPAQITLVRHYVQNGLGNRYIDDLAVGDTRIGCSGSPSSDTIPPAAPVGLSIR